MTNGHPSSTRMLRQFLAALGEPVGDGLRIDGRGAWVSRYPVTDLACASIGAASLMLARWIDPVRPPPVRLDRRLASWWFGYSLRPLGWTLPEVRDAVTGDYAARDGWIRIHANAAHHRARALRVLGLAAEAGRDAVAARVRTGSAQALEDALVGQGACAAALRSPADWDAHPQAQALRAEPLAHWRDGTAQAGPHRAGLPDDPARPLAGLRVLDLTRVLAGPACTRFLAAHGAEVLRLDPASWDEPGMVPEVTVGKRCAALDLRDPDGRAQFERLLARADVLVHGYRPDALDGLGLGAGARQAIRPGLVDVSLDAWGWTGPWRLRRGFDSLVQMSTGIAWNGGLDRAPDPLPVQALDQATGYWMAACALKGLADRRARGRGGVWRVSLARTAELLASAAPGDETEPALGPAPEDAYRDEAEATAWGPARRLLPPAWVGAADWRWDRPAGPLRADPPDWR